VNLATLCQKNDKELLREKIRMKTADNYSQSSIYRLLGCPKRGITRMAIKEKLLEWGINAPAADLDDLFVRLKFGESDRYGVNRITLFIQL
jgi:hypothetical protein